jgi:hypothetical protein
MGRLWMGASIAMKSGTRSNGIARYGMSAASSSFRRRGTRGSRSSRPNKITQSGTNRATILAVCRPVPRSRAQQLSARTRRRSPPARREATKSPSDKRMSRWPTSPSTDHRRVHVVDPRPGGQAQLSNDREGGGHPAPPVPGVACARVRAIESGGRSGRGLRNRFPPSPRPRGSPTTGNKPPRCPRGASRTLSPRCQEGSPRT